MSINNGLNFIQGQLLFLFYRAEDACMYVSGHGKKAERVKDMIEVRHRERDTGARPASPFSPSFSFVDKIKELNSHLLAALGVYHISREKKGDTQNP